MNRPSRRAARTAPRWLSALLIASCAVPAVGSAQRTDTTRTLSVPSTRVDSIAGTVGSRVGRARIAGPLAPPLTPRRAFLYSLLVPGLGQAKLDRGTAGAFFAAIEVGSWAMFGKTGYDLREARRFSGDTLPNNYLVGTDGKLAPNGTFPGHFPVELVNTRRLHVEDWVAALAFNHLISGADAFVAAQLWDVPANVSLQSRSDGLAVVATIHW
jgi:hypothetical protein